MALKYHLVSRPDMRKDAPAGSKLLYGQIRVQNSIGFDKLCDTISAVSTASKGDVQVVISGLMYALKEHLESGNTVQVGELGNFRMSAGCSGAATAEEFNTSLFKKGKVIFTPGTYLKDIGYKVRFEKMPVIEEKCTRSHME